MTRIPSVAVAVLGLASALSAQPSARTAAARSRAGIAIGDLVWTDGTVDRAEPPDKTTWKRVAKGDALRTGDTLRTGEAALARVDFPWMTVTLGPSSMLSIPASAVLSTVLDQGRAEFSGPGREIVKIQVGDGEVRGGGHVIVRRSVGRTSVTALAGAFRVRAVGRTVEVKAGEGTTVTDGRPPNRPSVLPAAPVDLQPGADVAYVRSGQPVELRWSGAGRWHHVQLLALDGDQILLSRDATAPLLRLEIPWLGTYRWRVSSRDERGIESPPSAEGLVCSVER